VLEHVDHLEDLIGRFRSILQPGGTIIISGPTESDFYKVCRKIAGFRKHYHVRSISDIERSFKAGNFTLAEKYKLPGWLPLRLFEVLLLTS
jgi:2-polyprenyl-3-methyl-5-hydroxy-6-metoxy-1,4-benzoquinol methylase